MQALTKANLNILRALQSITGISESLNAEVACGKAGSLSVPARLRQIE
jgi:hypothetical protein